MRVGGGGRDRVVVSAPAFGFDASELDAEAPVSSNRQWDRAGFSEDETEERNSLANSSTNAEIMLLAHTGICLIRLINT